MACNMDGCMDACVGGVYCMDVMNGMDAWREGGLVEWNGWSR